MAELSDARKRAKQKYQDRIRNDEEKREQRNHMSYKRTARSFIRKRASFDELKELEQLIAERKETLKNSDEA